MVTLKFSLPSPILLARPLAYQLKNLHTLPATLNWGGRDDQLLEEGSLFLWKVRREEGGGGRKDEGKGEGGGGGGRGKEEGKEVEEEAEEAGGGGGGGGRGGRGGRGQRKAED
jgi:hypothetical protein